MDSSKQKEYISIAYLRSISAKAKVIFSIEHEDSDSIDVKLKKNIDIDGTPYWSDIGIQLKATSSFNQYTEDENNIYYNLKVKNYNDLRLNASTRKYLALLILPEDSKQWIENDVDKLIIKKCMYWISLLGMPETLNTSTIQITIPKKQILNEESLNILISEVSLGGEQ